MKLKTRRDDTSPLEPNEWRETNDWREMNDWFAELRDDGRAEPGGDGLAEPARAGGPRRETAAAAPPAGRLTAGTGASARARVTGRAVIGDQLRLPIAWCEMGSCIWRHADPAALGEADIRARAIAAGWRVDALGRLACPGCQQSSPGFRASCPVALWDRDTAITTAAMMAAAMRHDGPGRRAAGTIPAGQPTAVSRQPAESRTAPETPWPLPARPPAGQPAQREHGTSGPRHRRREALTGQAIAAR
jgi:hypothetical protein